MAPMAYTPLPDQDWNPLRQHRNVPCPCESGKKAKHCHGQAPTLLKKEVQMIWTYLRGLSARGLVELSESEMKRGKK